MNQRNRQVLTLQPSTSWPGECENLILKTPFLFRSLLCIGVDPCEQPWSVASQPPLIQDFPAACLFVQPDLTSGELIYLFADWAWELWSREAVYSLPHSTCLTKQVQSSEDLINKLTYLINCGVWSWSISESIWSILTLKVYQLMWSPVVGPQAAVPICQVQDLYLALEWRWTITLSLVESDQSLEHRFMVPSLLYRKVVLDHSTWWAASGHAQLTYRYMFD